VSAALQPRYRRVLLKLSGEAFSAPGGEGLDSSQVAFVAQEARQAASCGVELAIVVGGGNVVRGTVLSKMGVDRATADYMGMLATVINGMALQDALERLGLETRMLTAIEMRAVAEPWIRRRALRHLEKGRIVILAAGTGNPHFTTDTAAALRAAELGAEVLLKATQVDGVYSGDPLEDPAARRYDRLAYVDVINRHLRVMDATAVTLCWENHLPIVVFKLREPGNIVRAICGEPIGTVIAEQTHDTG
jgi:uridylate kinase